jgi:hypothetical protein
MGRYDSALYHVCTLQHRLGELGTTYQDVLDNVRHRSARPPHEHKSRHGRSRLSARLREGQFVYARFSCLRRKHSSEISSERQYSSRQATDESLLALPSAPRQFKGQLGSYPLRFKFVPAHATVSAMFLLVQNAWRAILYKSQLQGSSSLLALFESPQWHAFIRKLPVSMCLVVFMKHPVAAHYRGSYFRVRSAQ